MTRATPDTSACCAAPAPWAANPSFARNVFRPAYDGRSTRGQVPIPAASFDMGDSFDEGYRADGETPVHAVELDAYAMDETAVTNAQFATFVKATGYVTEAEDFGISAVFHLAVAAERRDIIGAADRTPWWLSVRGASWRHPDGSHSTWERRQNHPVVHVSWNDAQAYCEWAGKRLPTEAEWEHAARGGLVRKRFAWGNELTPRGRWRCNIWQGGFPTANTGEDGHLGTAPVRSFGANDYGLWNTAGNVWEWCADWFDAGYYASTPAHDPRGPSTGEQRVMRGGSYLCHASYCHRYRVSARSSNTPESTSANIGFRCANDA